MGYNLLSVRPFRGYPELLLKSERDGEKLKEEGTTNEGVR